MLETSARLLRLLSLLQTHGGLAPPGRSGAGGGRRSWSGAELAERLGVTPRTVRRDVDRLRELGYPVHSVSGTAGGYQLGAGAELPPLLLDDEEAVAVALGLRMAPVGIEGVEESSVRALAKLEQVLPDRLRRRVSTLNAYTVPMTGNHAGPAIDPHVLTELAHACRDRQRVRFAYRAHDGEVSRRSVEPLRLVCSRARWYLVAWDLDRTDWRTFRADRITPKPPHGPRFDPREPPADDLGGYVSERVSIAAYAQRATVLLKVSAERAAEHISPTAGVLEAVDEESCLLHTGAHTLDVLAVHVLLAGFDFEVREPPELRGHLKTMRDRLDRALG
ncbi:helix-turn-helix transcriptional regulator [Streptomyces sp. 796.1]|uniref:helix-turn-helix transcriptional regulator n=1 Tax=Streptomyces sp. 796.1 TaxID=3163029 RepID=UPI0039C9F72C